MGFLGGVKMPKVRTPLRAPTISDAQLKARAERRKLRKRKDIGDQILTLGGGGLADQNQVTSILGG